MSEDWEALCRSNSTNWLHAVIGGDATGPRLNAAKTELARRMAEPAEKRAQEAHALAMAAHRRANIALVISIIMALLALLSLWRQWR